MILMDRLTDKSQWHKKVFNEDIVAKWRAEALAADQVSIYRQIVEGKWQMDIYPLQTKLIDEREFDYV